MVPCIELLEKRIDDLLSKADERMEENERLARTLASTQSSLLNKEDELKMRQDDVNELLNKLMQSNGDFTSMYREYFLVKLLTI
jgi:peptidoglycan hydrolase CwlO-like protein